jgi:hypothetical protein
VCRNVSRLAPEKCARSGGRCRKSVICRLLAAGAAVQLVIAPYAVAKESGTSIANRRSSRNQEEEEEEDVIGLGLGLGVTMIMLPVGVASA